MTINIPDCSTRDRLAHSLAAAFSGTTARSRGWETRVTSSDGVLEVYLANHDNAFDVRVFAGADTSETYTLLQEQIAAYDWLPGTPCDAALVEILNAVLEDISPTEIGEYVGPFYRAGFGEPGGVDVGVVIAAPRGTQTFVIGAWCGGGEVVEHMRLPLSDVLGLAGVTLDDCRVALAQYAQAMAIDSEH